MDNAPIVIERTVRAPINKVWKAITDKGEMKNWYFDLEAFNPTPGFEFQFYGGSEEKQYLHLCKVIEVEQGKKLSYSWKYEGYPGESSVTFELFEEGDKTRIVLTHQGLESFPSDMPDFKKESFLMGWTQIIGTNLPNYVENEQAGV